MTLGRGSSPQGRDLEGLRSTARFSVMTPFFKGHGDSRSPSSALLPCVGEGSPTKIDYRKKGTINYSSLPTGGPSVLYEAFQVPHDFTIRSMFSTALFDQVALEYKLPRCAAFLSFLFLHEHIIFV